MKTTKKKNSKAGKITKCYLCGSPAAYRITVKPASSSLHVCDDPSCSEDAYFQLDHAGFDYQGRRRSQVEYTEATMAATLILLIVFTIGVLVYKMLTSL